MTALPAGSSRIDSLDILRGVAVMGILAMNAVSFAMPEAAYSNPAAYGGASGVELAAWAFNFVVFDGKMRALFSLLFGASMLLIIDRAEAAAEDPAAVHFRRMAWLALFGAVHFYLIWWGDILLHYALVGSAAFLFHRASKPALVFWILVLVALDWMIMADFGGQAAAFEAAAARPGAAQAVREGWDTIRAGFSPLPADALAQDLALHRGDPLSLVQHRLETRAWLPLQSIAFTGPETLAFMLMGMLGLRTGFLTDNWSKAAYLSVGLGCTLVGIAGFVTLAAFMARSGFDPVAVILGSLSWTVGFRLLMVVGYAALIVAATRNGGVLVSRIAAAGRAAFTNYLGTSIVMTAIFYGYGFGLYGSVSRAELWIFVLLLWAVMLLWSKPWLDRYRYGPFEWLWRSLARGRRQPIRRMDGD